MLYRCEDGVPVEIMMYPPKNPEYLASLSLGLTAPTDPATYGSYLINFETIANEKPNEKEEKNTLATVTDKDFSSFTIPGTVTVINELCFAECSLIKEIIIGDKVTDIETMAFFKCWNLQNINIPDSVINIGSDAFSSCTSVKDIFIPKSVKTIGHHAFYNCSSVNEVRMECSEEEAKDIELGSAWLPEQRKVIMRPIGISYNENREVE